MRTFARIVLGLVIISLILFLTGCRSAEKHLELAKKHQMLAEAKGAKITRQTVYDTVKVVVEVPADSGKQEVKPEIDEVDFFEDMAKNDSLVLSITSLHKAIADGAVLDKEKAMYALAKANREIQLLRNRIKQGYSKDSTYVYEADSLCTVKATVKNGLLTEIKHDRKPIRAENQEIVPVEIRDIFSAGYTLKQVIAASIGGAFLLLVIGFIVGYVKGKNNS